MKESFWRSRRVFLTGHTGFKGAWLAEWLTQMGAEVSGYSLAPPTTPSLFDALEIGSPVKSTVGDIRDVAALQSALRASRADVVIHMAAQALVRASYEDPPATFSTNVMGTANVLEAVRIASHVKAVLVVTTDKTYENKEWIWGYRETDRLGGRDPYSSSKACAELVTAAYRDSFLAAQGVLVATARGGNVIGGGDYANDRLVPDALRAFGLGEPVSLRNPRATRPWQHVLELLRGYLTLSERLHDGDTSCAGAWNFGPAPSDVRPVSWVVEQLAHGWGGGARWSVDASSHPHEAHALTLDATKATTQLGWRPVLPLEDALPWVIEFERGVRAGEEARTLVSRQLARYRDRLAAAASS